MNLTARRQDNEWEPVDSVSFPLDSLPDVAIRKVLVPVDFSECSRSAVSCAVSLATRLQAEVVLLHVFEPVPPELKIMESVFADPDFREQAARELDQWHAALPSGLTAKAIVRPGRSAPAEILKAAAEEKVDLIVMGRQKRKGLERILTGMGRTASQVFRQAPCAVLVTTTEDSPRAESSRRRSLQ